MVGSSILYAGVLYSLIFIYTKLFIYLKIIKIKSRTLVFKITRCSNNYKQNHKLTSQREQTFLKSFSSFWFAVV
jgi:hypothetical protein